MHQYFSAFFIVQLSYPYMTTGKNTYRLGSSSFSVPSFFLFILFLGFSKQEY